MVTKYIIDTNVIRDLSTRSKDDEAKKQRNRCRVFWEQMKDDPHAILLIPEETRMELEVQLLANIPPKIGERERIDAAIHDCQIAYEKSTREVENKLRELSAVLKSRFGSQIQVEIQVTPQHMQVSDARILCAALEQDGVLVTRNIKDFILYLFLSDLGETILFDTSTAAYVSVSAELYQSVLEDEEFSRRLDDFFEVWNQLD